MSAASRQDLRKGWCPGALRPMVARDGLLVRLRITGGIVPAVTAHAIADFAARHGNGLLDLSARANLQLRGVREANLPALWKGLDALGLLDADAEGEAVRNVLCSPMGGMIGPRSTTDDGRPDIRPLAVALEAALVADPALRALPPKLGLLLDDGGAPSLAGIAADLRYDWDGGTFAAALGGTVADALDLGRVSADGLVAHALAVLHRLLALPGGPRRPRVLLKEMGREAVAAWFSAREPARRAAAEVPQVVGPNSFAGIPVFGLALPYGRLDAAMLRGAAEASAGELRLTPWRAILLPGIVEAEVPGFIADPADPRLRVAACAGAQGCERGTTDTHAHATRLAPLAAVLPGRGIALHVSGCAKGCAHPAPAPATLVGREGRYDLVRDGRPGGMADRHGLAPEDAEGLLHSVSVSAKGGTAPHLPSPLWGGAGVGVASRASDARTAVPQPSRPPATHGLTPTPNPSPQGGGEFARGSGT